MDKTVRQVDGELSALRVKEKALELERANIIKAEEKKKIAEYSKYKGKFVWYKNNNAKNWKLGIFKNTSRNWDNRLEFNIEGAEYSYEQIKPATFDDVKGAIYTEPKKESK